MSSTNKPNSNSNNGKKNAPQQAADPNSRRQRLRAEQEKAAREARVRRIITFSGLGVVLVAVIGLVIWGVTSATNAAKQTTSNNGVSATYAAVIGKDGAPVTLDVFQDFMCPVCGEFEKANSEDVAKLVDAGTVRLRIHPMNFLDESSLGAKYSTRAANAFVTVWKAEPDKALAFNKLMYTNQPQENTTGLTDDQIAQIAAQAGVSQSVIDTFTKLEFAQFSTNATNEAYAAGVTGTPTVFINGTKFTGDLFTTGVLSAAIEQAAKAS